jgi:ubiquinol-cytochrome c reductase cytochrome c1 subunit
MTKTKTGRMARVLGALAAMALLPAAAALAQEADKNAAEGAFEHYEIPRQKWTYGGIVGHFDEDQLRRGYKVYKDVCAGCHNLRLLSFRNLGEPGGPRFSREEVEAIAAEAEVSDGYDDQGTPATRKGKPSDNFQWTLGNEKKAAAMFNGAVPPDLSLMTKARTVEREFSWYAFPFIMLRDLATQYQEQGSDYIYALMTGYRDQPPAGKTIASGLNYNKSFPGNQLAMPAPLGTFPETGALDDDAKTREQQARDVTAFLAWAADPHLVERKKMGIMVLVYLGVLSILLLIAKKTLWRNVEH